jgi:hypothetical protein
MPNPRSHSGSTWLCITSLTRRILVSQRHHRCGGGPGRSRIPSSSYARACRHPELTARRRYIPWETKTVILIPNTLTISEGMFSTYPLFIFVVFSPGTRTRSKEIWNPTSGCFRRNTKLHYGHLHRHRSPVLEIALKFRSYLGISGTDSCLSGIVLCRSFGYRSSRTDIAAFSTTLSSVKLSFIQRGRTRRTILTHVDWGPHQDPRASV